jgi:hypothetical protein
MRGPLLDATAGWNTQIALDEAVSRCTYEDEPTWFGAGGGETLHCRPNCAATLVSTTQEIIKSSRKLVIHYYIVDIGISLVYDPAN